MSDPIDPLAPTFARVPGDDGTAPTAGPSGARAGAAPHLPPGTRVGRYLIVELKGAGGMGEVYAAFDPQLDRKVALKVVRPAPSGSVGHSAGEARLLREAQALAKVNHRNVAAVHDVGAWAGRVFFAMELLEGESLQEWLQRPHRWQERLRAFLEAGEGLAAAHQASIIHRDFKPANALVTPGGRIVVLDFGLARASDGQPEHPALPSGPVPSPEALTVAGAVMGTPGYMAPEQLRGEPSDARADQYAFAICLYEALAGVRLFQGDSFPQLRAEAERGFTLAPVPGVPARVLGALGRALAPRAEDRFPTIEALLEELRAALELRRRRRTAALTLAGATLVGALVFSQSRWARGELCAGSERHLAGAWDEARALQLERSFRASGAPGIDETIRAVRGQLDGYASAWTSAHREACEATRLRGEQTEAVLDRRMGCLDERLAELSALTSVLASSDRELVARAPEAISRLPLLSDCSDLGALLRGGSQPSEAERPAVEEARRELAAVRAQVLAGHFKQAREQLGALKEMTRELRFRRPAAEALALEAELLHEEGNLKDAEAAYYEAALAAGSAGADERAADLLAEMTEAKYEAQDLAGARQWLRLASMWVDRLSAGNGRRRALLAKIEGHLAYDEGRTADSVEWHRKAVALHEAEPSSEDGELALHLYHLGFALRMAGEHEEAIRVLDRTAALQKRLFGERHHQVGYTLSELGNVYSRIDQFDRAEALAREAMAINLERLGADHPTLAFDHNTVGTILAAQGRFAEAERELRAGLALLDRSPNADQHVREQLLTILARALPKLGRPQEGLRAAQDLLRFMEGQWGPRHVKLTDALSVLGHAHRLLRDYRAARRAYLEALEVSRDDPNARWSRSFALSGLAQVALAEGRATEALALAEELWPIRKDGPEPSKGGAEFLLLQARWQLGQQRAQAPERARQILTRQTSKRHAGLELRAEIEQWLAKHDR